MNKNIFLLLGSNIGKREDVLSNAIQAINNQVGKVITRSSIYETAPWGNLDQSAFLNQVICIESKLNPLEILHQCQEIELNLGRTRHIKWGARTIDIDILYYDNVILNSKELTIPHPHLHERNFTLIPLVEIAQDYNHPLFKISNYNLQKECNDQSEVNIFKA